MGIRSGPPNGTPPAPPRPKPINQMTLETCRMRFPKAKWLQPPPSPTGKAEIPEAALQGYADEAIKLRGWSFIRFPSALMGWLKRNAPEWAQRAFFTQVGGRLPDNLILAPIGPGVFLAVKLELKTQDKQGRAVGKLHGRQKNYAIAEGWKIARSPEQINAVLDEVADLVDRIKHKITPQNTDILMCGPLDLSSRFKWKAEKK